VPVFTANDGNESVPVALVGMRAAAGLEQLTGTALLATEMVGCPAAVEHCVTPPGLSGVNPDPVTDTVWPLVRLVLGVTVSVAAASAGLAVSTMNVQKMSTTVASVRRRFRRCSRRR